MRRTEKFLEVKKGTKQSLYFNLKDGEGKAVDLQGYEFVSDLVYKIGGTPIATLSTTNGGFIIDENNQIEMVLTKEILDLVSVNSEKTSVMFPFVNIIYDIEYRASSNQDFSPFLLGPIRVFEEGTSSN